MPKRSEVLSGSTRRLKTGCGNIYITSNSNDKGEVEEVFIRLGKAGGCASSQTEALGRLITLALRYGAPIERVVKQLLGIGCHQPIFVGSGRKILSCADAVAQALSLHQRKEEKSHAIEQPVDKVDKVEAIAENLKKGKEAISQGACPDCGSPVTFEEG